MVSLQGNFMTFYLLCVFIVKVNSDTLPKEINGNNGITINKTELDIAAKLAAHLGTHLGREHVIDKTNINTKNNKNDTRHAFNITKPVHEPIISNLDVAPHPDDGKTSVAKKGVNFAETENQAKNLSEHTVQMNSLKNGIDNNLKRIFNVTSANSSTIVHKKPLVTESDSDYINISESDKNISKENVLTPEQIDPLISKTKTKRSDYVVPIVVVILSVPLVAIAISFVYKRCADWWQHRNYKRMDFLIEGMYHN